MNNPAHLGWYHPYFNNARLWHYANGSDVSLCGKQPVHGPPDEYFTLEGVNERICCKTCLKKLSKKS